DWLLAQLDGPPPPPAQPEELAITPIGTPAPTAPAAQPDAPPTLAPVPTAWILTASVENHAATAARKFSVIGIKERNRKRALEIEPGDLIVLYLTKVMAFAGAIRVTGALYEDRKKIWPGEPRNPDSYPWRFPTEPVIVLPQERWLPAADLRTDLEHVQKWPAEHWKLAFQGQLRTVSEHDARLLLDRLTAQTEPSA
ncbi:MAG: EVE domain-containing protein, partial [Patulibacter sp.]